MDLRDEKVVNEFLIQLNIFFNDIDTELRKIDTDIMNKELERDDLLHEIELGNLNAIELSSSAKRLRNILKERRKYKEQREYVHTLKGFADKFITKGIIADSLQAIKNVENLNKARDERKYTPRILKDLKIGKWKNKEGI